MKPSAETTFENPTSRRIVMTFILLGIVREKGIVNSNYQIVTSKLEIRNKKRKGGTI